MSQFRRDYFELKRAEAVDIADPRSFAVHRRTSLFDRQAHRPRKAFCTLHSNRNCSECKKRKTVAQKRRRQRTLDINLLVNDFHGFRWIDTKADEYQTLTVSGQRIETGADILNTGGVRFQGNKLFFPELSWNRPILVTEQVELRRKPHTERKDSLESFEANERLPALNVTQGVKMGTSSEMKALESSNEKRRRIDVVLPKIS